MQGGSLRRNGRCRGFIAGQWWMQGFHCRAMVDVGGSLQGSGRCRGFIAGQWQMPGVRWIQTKSGLTRPIAV